MLARFIGRGRGLGEVVLGGGLIRRGVWFGFDFGVWMAGWDGSGLFGMYEKFNLGANHLVATVTSTERTLRLQA